MRQLPLPFASHSTYADADFMAAPGNVAAREWLARPEGWTNGRLVLWGEPGCGKSHLLHIWARRHEAICLSGPLLDDAPRAGRALAIDDADAAPDEIVLLHLLNSAAEAGHPVLLTAQTPPARLALHLPDLASRLRASLAVEISPPDEALLAALLARLAAERQLVIGPAVQNYLLSHLPRTPAALREAVARLDRAALDRHVKISRQLAGQLLADLINGKIVP